MRTKPTTTEPPHAPDAHLWPVGWDDPRSPFHVPEELRADYVVDQRHEWETSTKKAGRHGFGDRPLPDVEILNARHDAAWLAGQYDPDDRQAYAQLLEEEKRRGVTDHERALWWHAHRLHRAQSAVQARQRQAQSRARLAAQRTCAVCGQTSGTTRPRAWTNTGAEQSPSRSAPHGQRIHARDQACADCANVVQGILRDQAAAQKIGQRTRRDLALAYLENLEPRH